MQAIETEYKGYKFRSRLEARWAIFFDAIGVDWEYEPEAFKLSNGMVYLPDFKSSGFGWIEIKPSISLITKDEWLKMNAFVNEKDDSNDFWIFDGGPEFNKTYRKYIDRDDDCNLLDSGKFIFDRFSGSGTYMNFYEGSSIYRKAIKASRSYRFDNR